MAGRESLRKQRLPSVSAQRHHYLTAKPLLRAGVAPNLNPQTSELLPDPRQLPVKAALAAL